MSVVDKQKLISLIEQTKLEAADGRGPNGCVYFIVCTDAPQCKIGFTTGDIAKRLKALQTGSANELAIMCAHPGTPDTERRLHERFAESRIRGEWFDITDEIRAYIVVTVWAMLDISLRQGQRPPQWTVDATQVILDSLGCLPEGLAKAFESVPMQ